MDLRLKEDAKKGYFGRLSGGTDFNAFYEGELLFNKFNKDFKLCSDKKNDRQIIIKKLKVPAIPYLPIKLPLHSAK